MSTAKSSHSFGDDREAAEGLPELHDLSTSSVHSDRNEYVSTWAAVLVDERASPSAILENESGRIVGIVEFKMLRLESLDLYPFSSYNCG